MMREEDVRNLGAFAVACCLLVALAAAVALVAAPSNADPHGAGPVLLKALAEGWRPAPVEHRAGVNEACATGCAPKCCARCATKDECCCHHLDKCPCVKDPTGVWTGPTKR